MNSFKLLILNLSLTHRYSRLLLTLVVLSLGTISASAYAAPPVVTTVPVAAEDPLQPHDLISGKVTTLKGAVDSASVGSTWTWDPGDGSSTVSGVVNPSPTGFAQTDDVGFTPYFAIWIEHTYTGNDGDFFIATLTVTNGAAESDSEAYRMVIRDKTLPVEVNVAIDEALWFMHRNQYRYNGAAAQAHASLTAGAIPMSAWNFPQTGGTASGQATGTAAVINAFEANGYTETDGPASPYTETVVRGLRNVIARLTPQVIGVQSFGRPAGSPDDPDTNGNGIGVLVNGYQPPYQVGMAIDAIVASGTPDAVATTGPANVIGRTYGDIVQDMVDWYAWAQGDGTSTGGWRYGAWNNTTGQIDNSTSGWAAIGLLAAEDLFASTVPPWVKTRNEAGLELTDTESNTSSLDGQHGYTNSPNPAWGGFGVTGAAMVEMAMDDIKSTTSATPDERWIRAENFFRRYFSQPISGNNIRNYYYAMFNFAKAMRTAVPEEVVIIGDNNTVGCGPNGGVPGCGPTLAPLDWYSDPAIGLARTVVDFQVTSGVNIGMFTDRPGNSQGGHQDEHNSSWATQILTRTLFQAGPVARASASPNPGALNTPIQFDGSGSFHQDPARSIVLYEWDFDNDGTFDVTGVTATRSFSETLCPTIPCTRQVTLRVTDNNDPARFDTDIVIVEITIPPHPPTAVAGGPYLMCTIEQYPLDGTGSFDIDEGDSETGQPPLDTITGYAWELDGISPFDFDEAGGAEPLVSFPVPGIRDIGLRVTDNTSQAFPSAQQSDLTDSSFTTVEVADCSCIGPVSARTKPGKAQLVWAPVPGAVGYDILRSDAPNRGFDVVVVDHVTNYATYLDRGLTNGQTYWYRVVPKDDNGMAICAFSPAVSATPQPSRRARDEFVRVPDVSGLVQSDAENTLAVEGLGIGAISFENSDTMPEGLVIRSDPAAGSSVLEGSAVDIVISLGPVRVEVPDVVGQPQAAAEAAIVGAGLTVGAVGAANSDTVPSGNVISQDPVGGINVVLGSAVDIVISLGPVTVPVPDVVGSTQAAGEAAIVAAGLTVGAVSTANSDTVPAGDIISQDPLAGTSVVLATAVDIVVSLGPVTVVVPDVIGLPQADAEAAIVGATLSVGAITTQNSSTVPAGNVINQSPGAGSNVLPGAAVDLTVSLGPVQVTVPDVVGLPQADAEAALVAADLGPGTITEQNSLTVPAGNVISQDPAAGSTVDESSLVDLVISIGPRQVAVPDVVGLAQAAAEAAIVAADLTVGSTTTDTSPTVPAGDVISQNPVSGSTVDEQSAVDIVVSIGPAQVPVPDVVGLAQAAAEAAIVAADLQVGNVTTDNSLSVPAGDVISQNPVGGTTVDEQSAVDFVVSLGPIQVSVPDVVGDAQAVAEAAIGAAGLTVGTVGTANSDTVPAGDVISQDPVGGTTVDEGSAVDIVVSLGAADIEVPNVVGLAQAVAESTIVAAGLNVGAVSVEPSFTVPAGDVISQSPVGGQFAAAGSAVNLVVSDGAPPDDEPPVLSASLDQNPPIYDQGVGVQVSITASDNSGIVTVTFTLDGGAPQAATLPITSIDTSGFAAGSTHQIVVTAEDPVANSVSETLNFVIRDPIDTTAPTVSLSAPAELAALKMLTDVVGTADDPSLLEYRLRYAQISNGGVFTTFATGTAPVINDVLGSFDPTMLENGLYTIRLEATDANGNAAAAERVVKVEGEAKVGVNRFSVIDLAVPVQGVPIVVERSYDSRRKNVGDFGVGWELEIRQGSIEHNRPLHEDWNFTSSGGFVPLPCQNVNETSTHRSIIQLSDREQYTFALELINPSGSNVAACFADVRFRSISSESTRPGATLQILGSTSVVWLGGSQIFDDSSFDPYRVERVRLTTIDGRIIDLNANINGITRIADRNGNSLSIGSGGLVSSSGESITFNRDGAGRITSIVDPSGQTLEYEYDAPGDLVLFRDRALEETTYTYDLRHNIVDIIDPLGVTAARNEYDADGRLVAVTDARGNRIELTHDLAGRQEIVTDALGVTTVMNYDESGNITSSETPVTIEGVTVLATTAFAYDADGNQTVIVNADNLEQANAYDANSNPTVKAVDPSGLNIVQQASYNAAGEVLTETDPLGNTYSFARDASGNPTSFTNVDGSVSTATYDASGQLTQYEDAAGNTAQVTYASGRPSSTTDPLGNVTSYTYDANGNVLTNTITRTIGGIPTALTTTREYNSYDQVTRIIDPLGNEVRIEYNALGLRSAMIDQLGRRTEFTYDVVGDLVQKDYPDGTFETFAYDARGKTVEIVDREGLTTRFEYDELGRQVSLLRPDGGIERTVYTPGGRVAAQIVQDGARTDFEYDTAGRMIQMVQPAVEDGVGGSSVRPEWNIEYDLGGQMTAITDPLGNRNETDFDRVTRLSTRTLPDGNQVLEQRDELGRVISQTDAEGNSTSFSYIGSTPRMADVTQSPAVAGDPAPVWTFDYDEVGNLISQTDPLGRVTIYDYDELSRLIRTTLPGGQERTVTYDAASNPISFTDYDGETTTFEFDVANRLVRRVLSDGSDTTYSYTGGGSRATITDSRGVTSYEYDAAGRLERLVQPDTGAVEYLYDARNRISRITSPNGVSDYAYDALDRIVSIDSAAGLTDYAYDLAGNPVGVNFPNGVVTGAQFDVRGQLVDLEYVEGVTTLASYQYAYSPNGRRTAVTEPGSSTNFSYDALGRLIQEVRTGPGAYARDFEYDLANNRTQLIADSVTTGYTYDDNDRMLTAGALTFSYDAKGNLTQRTDGVDTTVYGWTPDNRLASVNDGTVASSYLYDADGMRVQKTVGADVTRYLVDPRNPSGYSQVLEETNGTGTLQVGRVFGPLGVLSSNTGGSDLFHHVDGQRSTRLLTDALGAQTAAYTYDGFGNVVGSSGSADTTHRYVGQQSDAESGLQYMRARYYDSAAGRFLSVDPVPGDPRNPATMNRYCYSGNDPVNFADPNGEFFSIAGFSISTAISSGLRSINTSQKISVLCRFKLLSEAITLVQGIGNFGGFGISNPFGSSGGINLGNWAAGSSGATGTYQSAITIFKYTHPWAPIVGGGSSGSATTPSGGYVWRNLKGQIKEIALTAAAKSDSNGGREVEVELAGSKFGSDTAAKIKVAFDYPSWELKSIVAGAEAEQTFKEFKLCGTVTIGEVKGFVEAEAGWNFETNLPTGAIEVGVKIEVPVLPNFKLTIAKLPDFLQ